MVMSQGYYTLTRVTDFGPYVTKLILPVPEPVPAEAVSPESFSVYVERLDEGVLCRFRGLGRKAGAGASFRISAGSSGKDLGKAAASLEKTGGGIARFLLCGSLTQKCPHKFGTFWEN